MEDFGVYIAGPLFGSGRSSENVHRALQVAEAVRHWRHTKHVSDDLGARLQITKAWPFVPHLYHTWDQVFPHSNEDYWLDMDRFWLKQCKVLLVIPGVSPGTRKEEVWAKEFGLFVCTLQESNMAIVQPLVLNALDTYVNR